ncbi:MAG: hypothetical protein WAT39_01850 [Planctomycetota bacterium]
MTTIAQVLAACRAEHIPERESGLWAVRRRVLDRATRWTSADNGRKPHRVEPGVYTFLVRATEGTLHLPLGGETVMNDSVHELRTHLRAMLRASGRVLVTGLGLGCCVRGMLALGRVDEVVVLEREAAVLHLVAGSFAGESRVRIVHAEAEDWLRANPDEHFDTAWHDVWTNREEGEDHLAVKHSHLMKECLGRVREQGAWAFPKWLGRKIARATRDRAEPCTRDLERDSRVTTAAMPAGP